jgi:hypothetical protein
MRLRYGALILSGGVWLGCSADSSDASSGGSSGAGTGGGGNVAGWPSGGAGGSAGSSGSGGTAGTLPELPCDDRFVLGQNPVFASQPFSVTVTDTTPYVYIDLLVSGPGAPSATGTGNSGEGPWSWSFSVSGHGVGVLELTFVKDKEGSNPGTEVASCQVHSIDSSGTGGSSGSGGAATGGSSGSSGPPPPNRYGMGYVHEGNAADHELTAKLTGPGGWVTLIFADIKPSRSSAEPSWKSSISEAYARELVPVIRMAPPWGDRRVRNMGESPTSYKALAQAYAAVIADLPKRDQWPIYVQVHNEPNLCYEWVCDAPGTLTAQQIAGEYAHMLRDVADALHALGDPRIKVLNGALAPGGVDWCECGSDNFAPGTLATTFLGYMAQAVPGVFDKLDAFASHAYPAKGEGWGFFPPYAEAMTGLLYFEKELQAIGKPGLKVLVTETGWTIQHEGYNHTRDQVADWSVLAYQHVWLTHPSLLGITPFILRDGSWNNFAWVETSGNPYPVYNKVRAYRCAQPGALNCQ